MTLKLLAAAALVASAAPAGDQVALPDYGSGYRLDSALRPIMPICLEALAVELQGGSFGRSIDAATAGWPADRTWRVREICIAVRTGAIAVVAAQQVDADRRERSRRLSIPERIA